MVIKLLQTILCLYYFQQEQCVFSAFIILVWIISLQLLFFLVLVLEPDEQLSTLQLLIYLLPPCNCDTLHRLLQFLSTVASHAEDSTDKDGQEVSSDHLLSLNPCFLRSENKSLKKVG